MSSGDANPTNLTQLLKKQFDELMSDDIEVIMQQFFDLDVLDEASSSQGKKKRKVVNRGRKMRTHVYGTTTSLQIRFKDFTSDV
jgi:hypothetical protein